MRVEISYKFVMGFIIVVGSVVLLNYLVPLLPFPEQFQWLQQPLAVGGALVIGLVLGSLFSKTFTANIKGLREGADRLKDGDLSRHVSIRSNLFEDETTDLANSLNTVVDSLRELVGYIRSSSIQSAESAQALSATSQEMTASAHDVAKTVEQISRGADTQAEMVDKSSTLIREMAMSIDLVAASAKKVESAASETVEHAQAGGSLADQTMAKMQQVFGTVEQSGKQMVSFGRQVQEVGQIVEVITGIAQKTNLLALNATIEAARAGEYGRGFAVVAEEIRKLADSTSASANEITQLINAIKGESQRVLASIQQSMHEVEEGHRAVDSTGKSFGVIIQTAVTSQAKAKGISDLTQTQSDSAKNVVAAIEEIATVVADNAAAVQEVSAATEEQSASMEEMAHQAQDLSSQAESLLTMVKRFHLGVEQ
jgi:methyl-accepting chemotaxis protein